MSNFEHVSQHMIGRIAMQEVDAALVEKYAALCDTWLEIGTLWGGSAILAALANLALEITCIDPMTGYYGNGVKDKTADAVPGPSDFRENLRRFDLLGRVQLLAQKSEPFPGIVTDGILVDGAHDYDSVCHDVREACNHAKKYILCHDINDAAVRQAVDDALDWGAWREIEASECMRVFQHD